MVKSSSWVSVRGEKELKQWLKWFTSRNSKVRSSILADMQRHIADYKDCYPAIKVAEQSVMRSHAPKKRSRKSRALR